MLTLSEPAAEVLTQTRSERGIPDDAMVRVSSVTSADGQEPGISLGFVDEPQAGDQTGTSHGVGLCVAPEVADALAEATIDVQGGSDDPQLVIVPSDTSSD